MYWRHWVDASSLCDFDMLRGLDEGVAVSRRHLAAVKRVMKEL